MHPIDELLKWLPQMDFAVLEHRFAKYGRDYLIFTENSAGLDKGQHEITFTHCVRADYLTHVNDAGWQMSWDDEFTNYQEWIRAKEPDGYLWGTNHSFAFPGIQAIRDSAIAAEWSRRLGKEMFEVTLETDLFFLRLIFHSIRSRKMNEKTDTVDQVIIPLK